MLTFAELTTLSQYDNGNLTTYSTPTLTAVANKLYVIIIEVVYSTPRTLTSVSGGGLGTWNIVAGCSAENGTAVRRTEVAWAWSASPGAGAAIDITFSGGCTGCAYAPYEITGFDIGNVVGQTSTVSGSSASGGTPTLASATAGNGILTGLQHADVETINVEAGWTAGEFNSGTTPNLGMRTAYRTDVSDLSCAFTWSISGIYIGSILEINASAAAAPSPPFNTPARNFQHMIVR